ncbi:heterocycloanthracin/sonorensin family bacteriocin [Bacillus cihuensis]|uniref:heterocycloanthracin/sonorensin family bacteriocin n=1 Tax=Bacillus cihuensis TaxID=1208599 RepID=UPI000424FEAC|nr:heterocycloanthracin/sonorensin family bacteriocin [Bacillus cihuensis]
MYNFHNDLQLLDMGNYQVGELMPVDFRQDPFQFNDIRRCGCGGCGRCGGCGGFRCGGCGGFGFRCGGCFGFSCFGFFI